MRRGPRRPGLTHYAGHNPHGHPRVAIARTGEQWCVDVHTNEEVDGTLLSPAKVNQQRLTPQACLIGARTPRRQFHHHLHPRAMSIVEYFGYDDCIALENESTRVVLCPHA